MVVQVVTLLGDAALALELGRHNLYNSSIKSRLPALKFVGAARVFYRLRVHPFFPFFVTDIPECFALMCGYLARVGFYEPCNMVHSGRFMFVRIRHIRVRCEGVLFAWLQGRVRAFLLEVWVGLYR